MNLLYIWIFTRNKVKKTNKTSVCNLFLHFTHICVTNRNMMTWHSIALLHYMALVVRRVGYIWPGYVCILPHVKLTWWSTGSVALGSISAGCTSDVGMPALSHMWNWHGVSGLCTTRVDWGGGICDLHMSAFLHMSNWHGVVGLCNTRVNSGGGVHLTWVCVHSPTCQTDMVY